VYVEGSALPALTKSLSPREARKTRSRDIKDCRDAKDTKKLRSALFVPVVLAVLYVLVDSTFFWRAGSWLALSEL
jgi:hypothetical protein